MRDLAWPDGAVIRRRGLLAAPALLLTSPAWAAFPDRTITLVTGFAPGGSTDVAARLLADRMQATLPPGGRVVVENRSGAGGTVASEWLTRQNPDGHIIMLVEASSHAVAPNAFRRGTRYDPIADYAPIAIVGTGPLVLVTSPRFPATTPEEMVAAMKALGADGITYASSGVGSIPHLAAEMFRLATGSNATFTHVPYRSGGQMVEAIAKNEAAFGVAVLASAAPQIRDARVRGIGLTTARRSGAFPEMPTLAETALPGFDLGTWNLILAPRGIPDEAVAVLNHAITAAVADPMLKERLSLAGVDAWEGPNTPADAGAFLAAEFAKFRDVVARTGVQLDM